MKQFVYTITDPVGIHARPAGLLVKAIKAQDSTVTIAKADGKSAAGTKLMALMAWASSRAIRSMSPSRAGTKMPTPQLWSSSSRITCKR